MAHLQISEGAEVARLAEEQAALRRVATLVARAAPPTEVFEAVISEAARLIPADAAALGRFEPDDAVTTIGVWSNSAGYVAHGTRHAFETTPMARTIFETRRVARMDDYEAQGTLGVLARKMGWRSAVGAPVTVEDRSWGVLAVASTTDRLLPPDTELRLAEFTALLGIAIAGAQSREELQRLVDQQAGLRRVATLVAEGGPAEGLFAVVAEEVAHVVGVPLVSIVRYETDRTATEIASFSDRGEVFTVGTRWPLAGTSVVSDVRASGRPARIDDYSGLEGVIAETVRRAGITSTVGIPIVVGGRLWGAMVVSSAERETLSAATESRLTDFTELVATAIANAESRAELDASRARIVATADATRRRIERDLHDGVQQHLVSVMLALRAVETAVPEDLHEPRDELARTIAGLNELLDELREIGRGIHPAILAKGGLAPALKTLARRSAVPVELDLRGNPPLSEAVEVTAYYVVSEAVTNTIRYSHAAVVRVTVEARGGRLHVSVHDDGQGGADPTRGSGLLGLKDRAEAMGGTMSLESPAGAGTSLHVELPLDDPVR